MEKLNELQEYLQTWLDRHKKASDIAPAVQESVEEVNWQLDVLRRRPAEAANLSTFQIDEQAGIALERFTRILPQMPAYDASFSFQVNSMTTSSSSATAVYVSRVGDIGTPAAIAFAADALESYARLQESHRRATRVSELLANRFPTVSSRFDAALQAFQQHRIGTGQPAGTAQSMRIVVDAIQGELFEAARTYSKENMTWSKMSDRLALDASGRMLLVAQESVRNTLYSDLSDAAKERSTRSIDGLWGRVLDHMLVVLSETRAG